MVQQTVIAIQAANALKQFESDQSDINAISFHRHLYILYGECLRIWSIGFIWNLWFATQKSILLCSNGESGVSGCIFFSCWFLFFSCRFYFIWVLST